MFFAYRLFFRQRHRRGTFNLTDAAETADGGGGILVADVFDKGVVTAVAGKNGNGGGGIRFDNAPEIEADVKIECVFAAFFKTDKADVFAEAAQRFAQFEFNGLLLVQAKKQPDTGIFVA